MTVTLNLEDDTKIKTFIPSPRNYPENATTLGLEQKITHEDWDAQDVKKTEQVNVKIALSCYSDIFNNCTEQPHKEEVLREVVRLEVDGVHGKVKKKS